MRYIKQMIAKKCYMVRLVFRSMIEFEATAVVDSKIVIPEQSVFLMEDSRNITLVDKSIPVFR